MIWGTGVRFISQEAGKYSTIRVKCLEIKDVRLNALDGFWFQNPDFIVLFRVRKTKQVIM